MIDRLYNAFLNLLGIYLVVSIVLTVYGLIIINR